MKSHLVAGICMMVLAGTLAGCKKQTKATHDDDEALAGEIQALDDSAYMSGGDAGTYGGGAGTYGVDGGTSGAYAPSSGGAAGAGTAYAPAPTPTPAPPAPAAGARTHTVRRGDTLWSIAKRTYGDGKRWHQIAAANPGVSPTRLRVGQTLVLP